MKDSLAPGASRVAKVTVDRDRTIDFMGDECRVYATPSLIRDIEHTCRDLIVEHADAGEDSVGFEVFVQHTAPTLLGSEVIVSAKVAEVDGKKVTFEVTAADPLNTICSGRHVRFVVDVAKTAERLKAQAAKLAQSG